MSPWDINAWIFFLLWNRAAMTPAANWNAAGRLEWASHCLLISSPVTSASHWPMVSHCLLISSPVDIHWKGFYLVTTHNHLNPRSPEGLRKEWYQMKCSVRHKTNVKLNSTWLHWCGHFISLIFYICVLFNWQLRWLYRSWNKWKWARWKRHNGHSLTPYHDYQSGCL